MPILFAMRRIKHFALSILACAPASLLGIASGLSTFTNPIIYSDFPDNDVTRGPDGAYYFSASSFQFSPGAPILKSLDLVNWELIGHSVPDVKDFGSGYQMQGTIPYVGGVWASTMRYRKSNGKWYWIGCIGFWTTYIYTASSVTGPWALASKMPGNCYYDCGLLIDDDDTMYVVHDNTNIKISQLSADGLSEVKVQKVFGTPPGHQGLEGNRLYKVNGTYYILDDDPGGVTFIWKSSSIFGNWTYQILQSNVQSPLKPQGGLQDQGSLIEAPDGRWYFMSCSWSYPSGRLPILAPLTWSADGWPSIEPGSDGQWGASYPFPNIPAHPTPLLTGTDNFTGPSLAPAWEWNFSPDSTKYEVNNGLTLFTASVTNDIYKARNTLTHRTYGPYPVGTAHIDFSNMKDGDVCGLAAFRDLSAWISVSRSGDNYTLSMVSGALQNSTDNWTTISTGTTQATAPIAKGSVYLRVSMDTRPGGSGAVTFSYGSDGAIYTQLGNTFTLTTSYNYFTGYRFGIFNFATKALGGSIKIIFFSNETK